MKPLILLFMLALCTSAYAQIQEQEPEGLGTDMPMTLDAEPMNETPADEVRGITYEKEGKMCFVMGDDTKKGLYNHIAFSFDNKSYIVKKGNLYGIANNKAEITVEITYDSIFTDYTCGAGFVVKQHGKYGKITSNGAIMLAIKYQKIIAGNQHITLVENSKNKTELIFNNQNKALNKDIDYAELYQNLTKNTYLQILIKNE